MRSPHPIFLLLGLAACDGPAAGDADAPTWHRDVGPLVAKNCVSCHTDGGIAPFSLEDPAQARAMSVAMLDAVETGRMPPWGAQETDECQPRFGWKEDLRLSEAEKATLRAWVEAGTPEGDPADAPEPVIPPPDELDRAPEISLVPEPWTVEGESDQFRCFVLDPQLESEAWMTAWQIVPGDPKVAHHALIFLDREAESASVAPVGGSYECFGSSGLDGAELIGAWAPGGGPVRMPPDTGTTLPPGARIVIQMHYHPVRGESIPDATAIEMWTTTEPPGWESSLQLLGNFEPGDEFGELLPGSNDREAPEFRVPAGVAGHVETMAIDLPSYIAESRLWAVGTHMHYVGTDLKITVDRRNPRAGEPDQECLIQTPAWDFNWQRGYAYDAELDEVPVIRRGDRIEMRCTYDNTTANPAMVRALTEAGHDEPIDVLLGEETLDEMCLGAFILARPRE